MAIQKVLQQNQKEQEEKRKRREERHARKLEREKRKKKEEAGKGTSETYWSKKVLLEGFKNITKRLKNRSRLRQYL